MLARIPVSEVVAASLANVTPLSVSSAQNREKISAEFAEDVTKFAAHAKPNIAQPKLRESVSPSIKDVSSEQSTTERVLTEVPTAQASIHRWYGQVLRIREDGYFEARIEPLGGGAAELADFPVLMVSMDDRTLLKVGASFSYGIFFESRRYGRRTVSALVFRRTPIAMEHRLRSAEKRAEEWLSYFEDAPKAD